jgi:hypothetical protein
MLYSRLTLTLLLGPPPTHTPLEKANVSSQESDETHDENHDDNQVMSNILAASLNPGSADNPLLLFELVAVLIHKQSKSILTKYWQRLKCNTTLARVQAEAEAVMCT